MKLGAYEVETIVDGTLALDGGSMFGVVPRALWSRSNPPDDRNRISLASRLLLIRGGGRTVLVDTGLGDRWSDKERKIYAVRQRDGGIVAALGRRGILPEDVTDVILTHLHFDHAAGTVRGPEGEKRLTFPRATHHLQRRHWEWALSPTLKDQASFRPADFSLLQDSERLHLVEGRAEILDGIEVLPLDGHTRGMQAVRVRGDDDEVLYPADLVPTATHVPLPWVMAYDNQPLVTLTEKRRLLGEAAREGWILVLEHDPETAAIRLEMDGERPEIAERIEI